MKNDGQKMQYLDEIYENVCVLGQIKEKIPKVFLAKHRQTGKIVVKKYLDFLVLPVYEKMKMLQNRHLERVYDCAGDGVSAIAITEFISGVTLREYIEKNGSVQEKIACSMIKDLLEGLIPMHAQGIIHRDINPENIMISGDGVLKLIDFGIARTKKENQTRDTTILGTAGYAAPEQFGFGQTDERSDIYAVGVLMNVLLVGQLPNVQRYCGALQGIIERCLCMDVSKRFQSARELYSVLMQMNCRLADGMNGYGAEGNLTAIAGMGSQQTIIKEYAGDGRQEKEKFIVSWLPGFRTGKPWKNVVATLGYIFMILTSVLQIAECAVTVDTFLLETIAVIIYAWITPLLTANAFNWDRRIWPFKLWPKTVTIVIRVILCILLFYAGVCLENYVKYNLLGLVPPK